MIASVDAYRKSWGYRVGMLGGLLGGLIGALFAFLGAYRDSGSLPSATGMGAIVLAGTCLLLFIVRSSVLLNLKAGKEFDE